MPGEGMKPSLLMMPERSTLGVFDTSDGRSSFQKELGASKKAMTIHG